MKRPQETEKVEKEQGTDAGERDWETSAWFQRWLELIHSGETPKAAN